jgi:NAD(P) transhydrogenase
VDEFSYVPPPGADEEYIQMKLNDGSTMETDLFFAATGRYPVGKNEETGLASAGVDIADRGMVNIDKTTLLTSSKNVYAAGDVIGAPALASTSMEQAQRAVSSMFSESGETDAAQDANHDDPLSIGVWTIPEMGYFGLTKEQAERDGYNVVEGSVGFDQCLRGRVFAPDGLLKLVVDSESGTVLGVHIIGKEAAEMVHYGMCIASNFSHIHLCMYLKVSHLDTLSTLFRNGSCQSQDYHFQCPLNCLHGCYIPRTIQRSCNGCK